MAEHHAFWHVYLSDNKAWWFSVVMDQLNAIVASNLHTVLDSLNVTIVHSDEVDDTTVSDFLSLVTSHVPDCSVVFTREKSGFRNDCGMMESLTNGSNLFVSEKCTHAKMYDHAWKGLRRHDTKYLYFHTKGITRPPGDVFLPRDSMNYYYWRKYLNYSVLECWKECVGSLTDYDSVGPGLYHDPETHYSGGHWWATAAFIQGLPDPRGDWSDKLREETKDSWLKTAPDRFYDEMWVGMNKRVRSHKGINNMAQALNPPRHTYFGESYRTK